MTSEEERTYRHAMNEESELYQKLSLSTFRVFLFFYGNGITFDPKVVTSANRALAV